MSEVNEVEQFSVDRTDTALVIKGDLPYELWVEQGKELNRIGGAIMWWLGDWWAFGEKKYGERAAAVEGMEWSFQTCRIAGWVSRNIETFRRLNVLTWQHHMEVAALNTAEQDELLTKWERIAADTGTPGKPSPGSANQGNNMTLVDPG